MPVKRWHFDVEDGDKVRLYDSESADLSKATAIKLPKSKTQEELGPVVKIETTEGKGKTAIDKYGAVHGLFVSILGDKIEYTYRSMGKNFYLENQCGSAMRH